MPALQCAADLRDLTFAEHLVVWAVRVTASGRRDCPIVKAAFADACQPVGAEALNAFVVFVCELARQGRRRILLAPAGCFSVTPDEMSIIAVFAAAQERAHDRLDAHMTWLVGASPQPPLAAAAGLVAEALGYNDHVLRPPFAAAPSEPLRRSAQFSSAPRNWQTPAQPACDTWL